jgi:hypothetical protein
MKAVTDDPRFRAALAMLRGGQYVDASDLYEELFFEAVRGEVPFVRLFLQLAVGLHHLDVLQWRPGVERLEEALAVLPDVAEDGGVDRISLRADLQAIVQAARRRDPATRAAMLRCVQRLAASAPHEERGGADQARGGEGAEKREQDGAPGQVAPAAEIERGGEGAEEQRGEDRGEKLGEKPR